MHDACGETVLQQRGNAEGNKRRCRSRWKG